MAENLSKKKRDRMISFLEGLKKTHTDDASIRAFNEIENQLREKKYGLVWEEHSEEVDDKLKENIPVFCADKTRRLCKDEKLPWNFIIEGDNLQALYLLEKTHKGKVDCIYIDPPYNSGARDWKYNNDYVDSNDVYRHSKWLSMMKNRLVIAKNLLNPENSVLICTIDEKEYLHLGCLLEEIFPTSRIQMISDAINPKGVARNGFSRNDEYIFCVMLGECAPARLPLDETWSSSAILSKDKQSENSKANPGWTSMMRRGSNSTRKHSPGCYYAIFVDSFSKTIKKISDPIPSGTHRLADIPNLIQVLPIRSNGDEGCWQVSPKELKNRMEQGRIRVGKETKYGFVINYLPDGAYANLFTNRWKINGKEKDGSLNVTAQFTEDLNLRMAPTQWKIASHNASENGSSFIAKILPGRKFPYPKSIYSTKDAINFFVSNKSEATIIDFFAGSGTTGHAINLLNAEDGGRRKWIMVTNNEISDEEEKEFTKRGIKKGDPEWEARGIAQYVTWPRTICTIEGKDINGNPLKGTYLKNDIPMAKGFKTNVKYFKCDWTSRKPEDYLLSNALALHIKEMIEIQNAIEIDNKKNVLILNKTDFKNIILDKKRYAQIEHVWVNQNIIFNAKELKLLQEKGYKYIPKEFFGQELREAAE